MFDHRAGWWMYPAAVARPISRTRFAVPGRRHWPIFRATWPPILHWLNILMTIAVLIATVFLAFRWRWMALQERGVVALLFAGLLINASVCALFSGVASRYQARVIMILPLVALAVAMNRREEQIKPV